MAQHVRVNFQQSLTVDGHSSRLHLDPTRLDHLSQRRGTIDEVSSHPLGPFSAEEKHDDTVAVDGLKALDPTPRLGKQTLIGGSRDYPFFMDRRTCSTGQSLLASITRTREPPV
jgi:hypothetical protein